MDGKPRFDGVRDFLTSRGIQLPEGSANDPPQAETVGGLLARHLGRIPVTGERFLLAGLEFDVLAATPTRVERVVIRRGPVAPLPLGSGGRP